MNLNKLKHQVLVFDLIFIRGLKKKNVIKLLFFFFFFFSDSSIFEFLFLFLFRPPDSQHFENFLVNQKIKKWWPKTYC